MTEGLNDVLKKAQALQGNIDGIMGQSFGDGSVFDKFKIEGIIANKEGKLFLMLGPLKGIETPPPGTTIKMPDNKYTVSLNMNLWSNGK